MSVHTFTGVLLAWIHMSGAPYKKQGTNDASFDSPFLHPAGAAGGNSRKMFQIIFWIFEGSEGFPGGKTTGTNTSVAHKAVCLGFCYTLT